MSDMSDPSNPQLFWSKVDRRGPDDCWKWLGRKNADGYGKFGGAYSSVTAHRLAWELTNGPVSSGVPLHHSCCNRACANPSHLFLGVTEALRTSGGVAFIVDADDVFAVSRYTWTLGNHDRYLRTFVGHTPERKKITLHAFLLGSAPDGLEWDHINQDRLDNRRSNLRAVTKTVNVRNRPKLKSNSSGITGVAWSKSNNKWVSYIHVAGRQIRLGYFESLESAANARRSGEERLW